MKSKFDHSFFNKSFKFMPVVDLCWVIYTNITSWLVDKSEVRDKILVCKFTRQTLYNPGLFMQAT